jgi:hypothetical protein
MVTSLEFFGHLKWLDGSPLLDSIEAYRCRIFTQALDEVGPDGRPKYNLILCGRGKKNWKSADAILACLYTLVIKRSHQGNDCFVLANDEGQASDDLVLAKRLIAVNPDLAAEIEPLAKELRLRDGTATLRILPSKDAVGQHGKSAAIVAFDEVWGYRTWDLLEALQPDPTRDSICWITSYASVYNVAGAPLHDLLAIARSGRDRRMLCSWYSASWGTDPEFRDLAEPEARANPSMASWPDGAGYLEQQRLRLPFSRYRRLHLNEPGAPTGAFFDQGKVLGAVISGRRSLPPQDRIAYAAYVDMSGGSSDDATIAIGHRDGRVAVVDRVEKQAGSPPFDPRAAVLKFCGLLREYGIRRVVGDSYAGVTFRADFAREDITYVVGGLRSASDLYEALEPRLNAGEVALPDDPTLIEQLVCLVWKHTKVTHESGAHDDHANAVAGLVHVLARSHGVMVGPVLMSSARPDLFAAATADATDPRVPADCRPVLQVDQSSWRTYVGTEGNGFGIGADRFSYPGTSW